MKLKWERLYRGQEKFLKNSGAIFWIPWLTEERYFLLRLAGSGLCALCGIWIMKLFELPKAAGFVLGIVGAVLGYFLPMLVFIISDKRDNEQMLPDIKKLYEYVKIQIKAGMYLTNTLSACYLAISNPRLKRALLELNSRLIATNSIPVAIREFEEKFTNEYITYFCLIVSQSGQSGRMAQMLEDMGRQMTDMERYLMTRKRGRMERKVLVLTLFLFIGIILVAAYQVAVSLLASVSGILY